MKFIESIQLKNKTYLSVTATETHITELSFRKLKGQPNSLTNEATKQLVEYFEGKRNKFNLPLKTDGTAFQKKVWDALSNINFGEVLTYKDVASKVASSNHSRAVGMACNKNPLPIFIPCHRVLGSNRSLTGYAGGIPLKKTTT